MEMAEIMGWEVSDEDIPPALEDFPKEVFMGIEVFNLLNGVYSGMGIYTGRDLTGISEIFKLLQVPESSRLPVLRIVRWLDGRLINKDAKPPKTEVPKS